MRLGGSLALPTPARLIFFTPSEERVAEGTAVAEAG